MVRHEKGFGRLQKPGAMPVSSVTIIPFDKNQDNRIDLAELKGLIAGVNKPLEYRTATAPPAMRPFGPQYGMAARAFSYDGSGPGIPWHHWHEPLHVF